MITKSQQNIIIETVKPFQPMRIGLFGSFARNEETTSSDIDIIFLLKNPIGLFTLSDLQFELEEKLHTKVDLISENGLNKFIKERVLKDVKYIYEQE